LELEGQKGKASTNRKGEVTWEELVSFVNRKVSETVRLLPGASADEGGHDLSSLTRRTRSFRLRFSSRLPVRSGRETEFKGNGT
jgi:hypothetical protein